MLPRFPSKKGRVGLIGSPSVDVSRTIEIVAASTSQMHVHGSIIFDISLHPKHTAGLPCSAESGVVAPNCIPGKSVDPPIKEMLSVKTYYHGY